MAWELIEEARRELELEITARAKDLVELEQEREKSENLQSVLQDFQAGKCYILSLLRTAPSDKILQLKTMNSDLPLKILKVSYSKLLNH